MKNTRGIKAHGSVVRGHRIRRGFTQAEVAFRADLDVKTVRKAEQGKPVDLSVMTAIAHVLNVDISTVVASVESRVHTNSTGQQMLDIARTFVAIYDTGGRDTVAVMQPFVTDDIEFHCPAEVGTVPFAGVFKGLTEIQRFFDAFYSFFERRQGSLQPDYLCSETRVVARFMDQVFFQGHEMPPHWVNLHFQFRDGLICRIDDEFDYFNARRNFEAVMIRLGISPPIKAESSP